MEKLDRWADDRRTSLKSALDELDAGIRNTKRDARMAPNLPAKLELQKSLRQMETKRNEAWKEYDAAALEVEKKKDQLLDEISKRLDQKTATEELFLFRWLIA
jgi:shikimate kinase